MKFHNHHGTTHPADKMLPIDMARAACPRVHEPDPLSRHGVWTREHWRLRGVIATIKRTHTKKSRAYGKRLCREDDRG